MTRTLWFYVFIFILFLQTRAQKIIDDKSEISGIWDAAHSPYLINGEAIVPENHTLIIKPGTRIEFKVGSNHDYVNPSFDLVLLC
ncbi:MAG: hypothetical protein J7L94_04585 [Caldisericaceae bacterium]|nr:hypothetical protein [Caldisericaceae bacterium]